MTLYFFKALSHAIDQEVVITGTNKEKVKEKYREYEEDDSFQVTPSYKGEPPIHETEDDFVRVIGDNMDTGDTNL